MDAAEDDEGDTIPSLNFYRGIVLQRESDGGYVAYPPALNDLVAQVALQLDVPILLTMSSGVTSSLMRSINPGQTSFSDAERGITMPVVESIEVLASKKMSIPTEFYVCLCKQEQIVLVWGDTVSKSTSHHLENYNS